MLLASIYSSANDSLPYFNVNESVLKTCYFDETDEETLIGDGDIWFRVSNQYISSHNDDGYQLYYYYCGDISSYVEYPWLPFMMWALVDILPFPLLAILCNIRNLSIFTMCPSFLIIPITSYFVVCPSRYFNKFNPLETFSKYFLVHLILGRIRLGMNCQEGSLCVT